jgi:Fic family protein
MTEQKRKAAIALVGSWLADTSGYDKRVWPKLARAIEWNRLSYRKRLESQKA